jgi:hypothetical protein
MVERSPNTGMRYGRRANTNDWPFRFEFEQKVRTDALDLGKALSLELRHGEREIAIYDLIFLPYIFLPLSLLPLE